jgi:hypothetical protein
MGISSKLLSGIGGHWSPEGEWISAPAYNQGHGWNPATTYDQESWNPATTYYQEEFSTLETNYYQEEEITFPATTDYPQGFLSPNGVWIPATTYYQQASLTYNDVKKEVLAIILRKFNENGDKYVEVNELIIEFTSALRGLHSKLSPPELVTEMLSDNSKGANEFIVAILYSYKSHKFVPFSDIETMCKSETSQHAKSNLFKLVFQNFKCFVSSTVSMSKLHPQSWPYNSFAADEFLYVSEKLWNDKLLPLANKILVPEQAKEWRLWGMDHFKFLKNFQNEKIEDSLLSGFNSLPKVYSKNTPEIIPRIQRFCFLVSHFAELMKNLDLPGALELFLWFSTLNPLILIHFFYYLENSSIADNHSNDSFPFKELILLGKSVDPYISVDVFQLTVFGTKIPKFSNLYNSILKPAKIILLKVKLTEHIEPYEYSISICDEANSSIQSLINKEMKWNINVRMYSEEYPKLEEILTEIKYLNQGDLLRMFVHKPKQLEYLLFYFLYNYESQKQSFLFPRFEMLPRAVNRNEQNSFKLNNIAKNFRIWVSSIISNSKHLYWSDSTSSPLGFRLLYLFKLLWDSQVSGMVYSWQYYLNYSKSINRIEERFIFLDSFLSRPTQDLLLEWHAKMLPEIKREIDEVAPAIQNFCFLAENFGNSLKDVHSLKYTETILWLERQSSDFIVHLCYFFANSYLDKSLRPFFRKVDKKRVDLMREAIEISEYLYREDEVLKIFGTDVPKSHKDFAKLCRLVESMKSKISKVDDKIRYK